uniref:Uncharacterized protein n=1 Tax=viral metagenome TaxID=1070528 RepID=A0A6C0D2K9_9ZZZZ
MESEYGFIGPLQIIQPRFVINDIKQRCKYDITTFCRENGTTNTAGIRFETALTSMAILKNTISKIVTEINDTLEEKNYVDEISHKGVKVQNHLWILRTYLFYLLLICVTIILENEELYKVEFSDTDAYPFRKDISVQLHDFKMGIFGSITPTSDIDIGVQYSGNGLEKPGLSYIVSRFENLFVSLTGKETGSLAYDIETYADMMTLPNPGEDKEKYPDYFYLDSSIFTEENFKSMLACAGKSIVRNVLLAYKDIDKKIEDLANITFDSIKQKLNEIKLPSIDESLGIEIMGLLNESTWFEEAKDDVSKFLNMKYEEQRKAYYEKVEKAEVVKFEKTKEPVYLTSDDICEMMVLIGDALTYRMESYTCSPTVVHVVRILQASKDKKDKYISLKPKEYCIGEIQHLDPFCSIGKYGYILSMLEQMGYIYRFYLTYCEKDSGFKIIGHYNEGKCKKKRDKYVERYTNALDYMNKYITGGGNKKPIYKRTRRRKMKLRRTRNKRRRTRK